MQALTDLLAPKRAATPDERRTMTFVLDAVRSWKAGEIPLSTIRQTTSGADRFLTLRFSIGNPSDFALMVALAGALVASDETAVLVGGQLFPMADLREASAKISYHRDGIGVERIRFPVRVPWMVRPDEHGVGGRPGEPIYGREP